MLEESLPEAFARIHDATENLSAKTELWKLIARLAGAGMAGTGVEGGGGEKFSVTINLGADSSLRIEKELSPQVIDAQVVAA